MIHISGKSTSKRVKTDVGPKFESRDMKPAYKPNLCICPKCPGGIFITLL